MLDCTKVTPARRAFLLHTHALIAPTRQWPHGLTALAMQVVLHF